MGVDLDQMQGFLAKINQLIGGFSYLFLRKHFKILINFLLKNLSMVFLLEKIIIIY